MDNFFSTAWTGAIRLHLRPRFLWRSLICAVPILASIYASGDVLAQRRASLSRSATGCQLEEGGESTVVAIAGAQTLHLADGRYLRLAGILVPAAAQGFDPSLSAMTYLRDAALGKKVEVKFAGTQRDRYGVYIGYVYVTGDSPALLQEGLAASGCALIIPQAGSQACTQKLLPAEAAARDGKRGLWGLAYFKVLPAADSRTIVNLVQTYQIVEGKVDHASESGGRITLHFSTNGKFGFTATIDPSAKKQFPGRENAESWAGVSLRIRGWIEKKRGPSISINLAEQIEFLTDSTAAIGSMQGVE
jgi:micrococcal nuclease